jgi:hypothetical protein
MSVTMKLSRGPPTVESNFRLGALSVHATPPRFSNVSSAKLLSFRMISETQVECRHANSEGETAWIWPAD